MKTIKKQITLITLLLSTLIVLQSCTVYKSTAVSLDKAVQNESKVKVITNSNEKLKYQRIGIENGNYYGTKKVEGVMIKAPLDEKYIASIKEKDKILSTILTIGILLVAIVGLIVILTPTSTVASYYPDFEF